jgi:hypothetical protein
MALTERPTITRLQSPAGARVEVHVLSHRRRPDWLTDTLESLAGEPCRVDLIAGGFEGQIGAARAFAFGLGTAEYVSFVDDDDYLLPGAMAACLAHLDAHPAAVGVYTDLQRLAPDGGRHPLCKGPWQPLQQLTWPDCITHLKLMRRSAVMPHLAELARWPTHEEYVLCGLMAGPGDWHHLPLMGAVKRMAVDGESSSRLSTPDLWRRAVARVLPALVAAGRRHPGAAAV